MVNTHACSSISCSIAFPKFTFQVFSSGVYVNSSSEKQKKKEKKSMVAMRNIYNLVLCVKCFDQHHLFYFSKNAMRQGRKILLSLFSKEEIETWKGFVIF